MVRKYPNDESKLPRKIPFESLKVFKDVTLVPENKKFKKSLKVKSIKHLSSNLKQLCDLNDNINIGFF